MPPFATDKTPARKGFARSGQESVALSRRPHRLGTLGRLLAVVSIFLGTAIAGFDPNRLDRVILDLPRGHGIHSHDIIGF